MTKEKFDAYVLVQKSGVTNMWDIDMVKTLSRDLLDDEDCFDIMKNYKKYVLEFGKTD